MTNLWLSLHLAMGIGVAIDAFRRGRARRVEGWWRLEPVAWFAVACVLGIVGVLVYRAVRYVRDRQPAGVRGWGRAGAGQEQEQEQEQGQVAGQAAAPARSYLNYPPRPQDGRPEPKIVYPATS